MEETHPVTDAETAQTPDFSHLSPESSLEEYLELGRELSTRHALPDGSIVPPTSRHLRALPRDEWRLSPEAAHRATRIIVDIQEGLGFVMPRTARTWQDSDYLANGRWISRMLGSPEEPVMPTFADVAAFSRLHLAPHPSIARQRFGNWAQYLDALGFVTQATLDQWSDKEWQQNGIWLSHMVGSPEAPAKPTQSILRKASKAGIAPGEDAINRQFGSLATYQSLLGFAPPEPLLDYAAWDKATYKENGVWLGHALRSPSYPKMPTRPDIAQGSALGLCPPVHAIEKRFRNMYRYQDALGFVNKYTLRRWTTAEWIANGRWLADLLGTPGAPKVPETPDLLRGKGAHITPSPADAVRKFGSMAAYQAALGLDNPRTAFRGWTDRQFLAYGLRVLATTDRPCPSADDYVQADGPTKSTIVKRFGSLQRFHELLGLPDYRYYDEDQILNFGVQWAVSHGDRPMPRRILQNLNEQGHAPHAKRVHKFFGSYGNFEDAIRGALPAYHKLAADLAAEPALDDALVSYLLRHFRTSGAYAQERRELGAALDTLAVNKIIRVDELHAMFARTRLTLHWNGEDFLYFGKLVRGGRKPATGHFLERLGLLDRAALAPYPQDIVDVFGSQEEFAHAVLAYG